MVGTPAAGATFGPEAPAKCQRCPRLVAYRKENESKEPSWFNGAVPSFGTADARFLIVGLAPGRNGANRTGRPFTGDYAGLLLYETLKRFGFAVGKYQARADDGFKLVDCMVTNAVRCAPPENKPEPSEITKLQTDFSSYVWIICPGSRSYLALGRIAHEQTLAALNKRKALCPFAHGARHVLATVTCCSIAITAPVTIRTRAG